MSDAGFSFGITNACLSRSGWIRKPNGVTSGAVSSQIESLPFGR